jgi:hypothetical protein
MAPIASSLDKRLQMRRTGLGAHYAYYAALGLLVLVGLGLLTSFALRAVDWYSTTHIYSLPPASSVVTHSSTTPSEAPIDTRTAAYKVAADQPRLLEIPTLGIHSFIQQVRIDQHQAIATPNSASMTGWYTGSARPGDVGVSIIDGHVLGRFRPAVFANLHKLAPSDAISVSFGNGRVTSFSVIKVEHYSLEDATSHLFQQIPGVERQLVLITCGGAFNRATSTYDERVLVYAKLQVN